MAGYKRINSKREINESQIRSWNSKFHFNLHYRNGIYQLLDISDLENYDMSKISQKQLLDLTFSVDTKFPEELLNRININALFNTLSKPTNGIDKMHELGVTGNGMNIAVIGSPVTFYDNRNYYGKAKYFKDFKADGNSVEGNVILDDIYSILPDVTTHYFPELSNEDSNEVIKKRLDYLKMIIEYNSNAKPEERILAVTLNSSFIIRGREVYGNLITDFMGLRTILSAQGCYIIDPQMFYDKNFLEQTPVFNDTLTEIVGYKYIQNIYHRETNCAVLVPGNRRLNSLPGCKEKYAYRGTTYYGWSNAIVATMFVACKSIVPTLDMKKFHKLAYETADIYNNLHVINMYKLVKAIM